MRIDVDKMTKAIVDIVNRDYVRRDNGAGLGFSAMCNICGCGSISFCPCREIGNLLTNPPKEAIIED